MEGRNYLEQMQIKRQAKKPPVLNVEIGKKAMAKATIHKPKVVIKELEDGEEPEDGEELEEREEVEDGEEPEPQKSHRKEVKMTDLRGKVPVDYELIMKRLQTNHITGVTALNQQPPNIAINKAAISIVKPPIQKTTTHFVIEEEPDIAAQFEKELEKEPAAPEPEEEPEPAAPKPAAKTVADAAPDAEPEAAAAPAPAPEPKKRGPKKKIVVTGKLMEKLPGPVAEEAAQKEPAAEAAKPAPVVIKIPKGKATKKIRDAIAMKLTKAEINRRMPKPEKLVVRTSQYYMNNRKMYVQKIKELFKPYEKELEEMGEIASCAKDPSVDFSLLTHQKIVRDYLNLFTPYRGLLLYHGLGSGKTCTSIGIAEGMKSAKEIIVMTPASLATNYFTEIKKCGDVLYRKNQFWEFVGIEGQPDNVELLSKALSIPTAFIEKKNGAWMVDVKKPPNFTTLSTSDQESIDEQLDMMIRSKYTDIHYNGMNRRILNQITHNGAINPFDNKTVIIDEVHNFVSRIVNKLNVRKADHISKELYNYLLTANNARVVALSGTPIINSPHELSVLYNILRGAIRTWTIPVRHMENKKITKEDILDMLNEPPAGLPAVTEYDYVEFSDNKLVITRNPIGFVNTKRREAKTKAGGSNDETVGGFLGTLFGGKKNKTKKSTEKNPPKSPKQTSKKRRHKTDGDYSAYEIVDGILRIKDVPKLLISKEEDIDNYQRTGHDLHKDGGAKDEFDKYAGVKLDESGYISDDQFLDVIKRILRANDIEVLDRIMKGQPVYNLALPDDSSEFETKFIDLANRTITNANVFKRRILGLTSYFRSAQESLLPRFVMNGDKTFHIEKISMSEHQLDEYSAKRFLEIEEKSGKREKQDKIVQKDNENAGENIYEDHSTYRVGSRETCNFVFPDGIERPIPDTKVHKQIEADKKSGGDPDKEADESGSDMGSEREAEDQISIDNVDNVENSLQNDSKYMTRINAVMKQLAFDPTKPRNEQYLTKEGMLNMLSPKMAKMMENIQNPANEGLHLMYSQFRHIEGIGIFKLILEANGYAEFKIKSVSGAASWEVIENEEDVGKPKFALYTGTESEEEKEIIRNIYNGDWGFVPKSIVDKLKEKSSNNLYGEIIKVLMITAAGAEGINLRNTRFVHITEPYWHNTRLEQVIGRARRICSHEQLPEELRTIQVFLYVSYFGEDILPKVQSTIQTKDLDPDDVNHVETTDEYLLRIATKKEVINKTFLKAIKESAMDCTLYKNKEGLMCYGVGMAKNPGNQFLSYPNIDQDVAERDDLNVKKTELKLVELKVEIRGVKYAIDKTTENLYDLAKYKNGEIELVGKLVRPGKGKTNYDIKFAK